ncbi:tail length tape measure protein [Vibrio phage Artemius]|nr:tail length tape measure protein [Vibrio phage Artemius]
MTVLRSTTFQLHVKNEDGVTKMRTFTRSVSDADETVKKLNEELGDNVDVTIKSANSIQNLTQNARAQVTQIEKANKAFERQKADLQQLINVTGKTGEEQAVLNAQYRLGSNATEEQRQEIAQLARQYYILNEAQNGQQSSLRNARGVMQNFGWQMQDTIVQLQMGTDWMIVMSQQGSQMAAAFGATGAVVGAVIALAGVALPSIIELLGETSASTKELEAAQKSLDEIFDTSQFTIKGYTDELRELFEVDQQFAELKILAATFEAEKVMKAARDEAIELTKEMRGLGDGFRFTNTLQEEYNEDLTDLANKFNLTTEEVQKLNRAAVTLKGGGSLGGFSAVIKDIATNNPNATESFTDMALAVAQAAIESEVAEKQLERLNTIISEGISTTQSYTSEIDELVASYNNKFIALDMTDREMAIYNARMQAGLDISGEELAALERSINAYFDRKEAIEQAEDAAKKREQADRKEQKELEKLERALDRVINKAGDWNKFTNQYVDGLDTIDEALQKGLIESVAEATELSDQLFEEFFNNVSHMFEDNVGNNDFMENFEGLMSALEDQDPTGILEYTQALQGQIATFGQMSSMMTDTFNLIFNGTEQVKEAVAEMNGVQQAMFFITQSIAAATAIINGIELGSKLAAMFPLAAPQMIATGAAIGGAQAGAIMGTTFAGMFDKGGYIPSGQTGIVSEYRDELVNGVLVKGPASVTGGDETSRIMSNGGMGSMNMYVDVQNSMPGAKVSTEKLSENRVRIIVREEMAENGDDMVQSVLNKPGSKSQKAISRNFQAPKRYS